MHNCRQTQAQLDDLVFNELTPDVREHVLAELADCAVCQAEYLALATLLRACDQAKTYAQPAEDFWPGYSARLDARVQALDRAPAAAPVSVVTPRRSALSSLRRGLTATLRVPVPVALAAGLLLVVLSARVLRNAPAPPQVAAAAPVRVVEVPVVQEKIVTRTVYVIRNENRLTQRKVQATRTTLAARRADDKTKQQATPDALVGFQPAGEVKLRVIKGSFTHER
ncbi:MAG: anti-sigma factor family protein [Pyrinomonadaceae bacterium]